MLIKVFPHGQGDGDAPTRYLVRMDYPHREENPPQVLRGSVATTRQLIDSLDTKWRFTAGVMSWHPHDTVTPEQEQRLMDDFEAVAFAGLQADQYNILWVRHSHAGHHELHFVIPRMELYSGKAFNPFPPGWEKSFAPLRAMHNMREGWERPDAPQHVRLYTPEHADLHNARLLRWGKKPRRSERAVAKEAIHTYLAESITQGLITSRDDVCKALHEVGLYIVRKGKDYITVQDAKNGEKLRLKGGIYGTGYIWNILGGQTSAQVRGESASVGEDAAKELQQLERAIQGIIAKRAEYNRKRYQRKSAPVTEQRDLALSNVEPAFRQTVSTDFAVDPADVLHRGDGELGLVVPVRFEDGNTVRANRATAKGTRHPDRTGDDTAPRLSGAGAVPRHRWETVSAGSSGEDVGLPRHRGRQTSVDGCTPEVSEHVGTRTAFANYGHDLGTGTDRAAERPAASTGRPQPASASLATDTTNTHPDLAAFDLAVQHLATLVAAFDKYRARLKAREQDDYLRMGM